MPPVSSANNDYWVYIVTNNTRSTLYIGVTSNLSGRIEAHQNDAVPGFTRKYAVHRLVHFELCDDIAAAIVLEKSLKKWNRAWKLQLIESMNPDWRDLHDKIDTIATLVEAKAGSPLSRG